MIRNVLSVVLKKDGSPEPQRMKRSWLEKRGHTEIADFLESNHIHSARDLYSYIYDDFGECECGNDKRFVSFKEGFKEYCEACARSKNNGAKKQGNVDVTLLEVIDYVTDSRGNFSSSKIKKLSKCSISEIKSANPHLNEDTKIAEHLFNIKHSLSSLPKCDNCGNQHQNFKAGMYSSFCSSKCSVEWHGPTRTSSLRNYFYDRISEELIRDNDEYSTEIGSRDDYVNKKELQISITHKKCGHNYKRTSNYQGHLKCPMCYPVRSRVQYEIFSWLSQYKRCGFNDRKLIAPLELDILCDGFAIEYDSLMYHSYGKSSFPPFENTKEDKNCHLSKTRKCEESGIQLFRIFSNEWSKKQEIWKSVILNKVGVGKRIHARKCEVKEVCNKEANAFLEKNHLQGKASQSIRYGLYHKGELVSLMTFGKSRYSKEIQYELIRFCSLINHTVVGGASKLLSHFERTMQPGSVVSYANRRWSTGGLYEKLGFTLKGCSPPNYFYFNSDTGPLMSRVQFQKHKLEERLEEFDPSLTETQNMFNNGFRKIYDCGNLVYVKTYEKPE